MNVRYFPIIALAGLLVFQSWITVSAVPEVLSFDIAAQYMQMDEHDCCDNPSKTIACELHCFSALSALVPSASALFAAVTRPNVPNTADGLMPLVSLSTVYRPPIT